MPPPIMQSDHPRDRTSFESQRRSKLIRSGLRVMSKNSSKMQKPIRDWYFIAQSDHSSRENRRHRPVNLVYILQKKTINLFRFDNRIAFACRFGIVSFPATLKGTWREVQRRKRKRGRSRRLPNDSPPAKTIQGSVFLEQVARKLGFKC